MFHPGLGPGQQAVDALAITQSTPGARQQHRHLAGSARRTLAVERPFGAVEHLAQRSVLTAAGFRIGTDQHLFDKTVDGGQLGPACSGLGQRPGSLVCSAEAEYSRRDQRQQDHRRRRNRDPIAARELRQQIPGTGRARQDRPVLQKAREILRQRLGTLIARLDIARERLHDDDVEFAAELRMAFRQRPRRCGLPAADDFDQ